MSIKINNVKGTRDLFGEQLDKIRFIEEVARDLSKRYLFAELNTPILEHTELFVRNLGSTSDVVSKEIYSFQDNGGNSVCLRPEFTAAVSRSFVANFQHASSPVKLFSFGPLFRYERPQKGRYRQFHQVNFEWIGVETPLWDVEAIVLAISFLKELGIKSKVQINSLGCSTTREKYRSVLIEYFSSHKGQLSADSLRRLENNPLRILDSKDPSDREIIQGAPKILEYHTSDAFKTFQCICDTLKFLDIEFSINHLLVRGLDYYSGLIFEFTNSEIGAQNALLGGGRYEQLSENLGGRKVSSVGFAAGIERLIEVMTTYTSHCKGVVSIIPIGEDAQKEALKLLVFLRDNGFHADMCYDLSLKSRMKRSEKSLVTVIFGENELSKGEVKVKIMDTGQEKNVALKELIPTLREVIC